MTHMIRVKICGLTRKRDIEAAVDIGADALGFVFGYKFSPRNLTFQELRKLIASVPPYVNTVVVSPASNTRLSRVVEEVRPTFLQVYQDTDQILGQEDASVIQTVHSPLARNELKEVIERCEAMSRDCRGILLDTASKKIGGTGQAHDWKLSRKIRDEMYPFPVILGGGLDEKNVTQAIREVRPYGVDVSSGVESSPGVKDEKKMKRFIENVKSA